MVLSLFIIRDAVEFYPDISVTKNQLYRSIIFACLNTSNDLQLSKLAFK